jgi:hypothetical protein
MHAFGNVRVPQPVACRICAFFVACYRFSALDGLTQNAALLAAAVRTKQRRGAELSDDATYTPLGTNRRHKHAPGETLAAGEFNAKSTICKQR